YGLVSSEVDDLVGARRAQTEPGFSDALEAAWRAQSGYLELEVLAFLPKRADGEQKESRHYPNWHPTSAQALPSSASLQVAFCDRDSSFRDPELGAAGPRVAADFFFVRFLRFFCQR